MLFGRGFFDLLQGTPHDERDLAAYLKQKTIGHEGYAMTTLSDSQGLPPMRVQKQDEKGTARAADACDNLGTGEQVIFQGEEVWWQNQAYKVPYLTKAVADIRRQFLPDLKFSRAMVLVGTLGK